MGMLCFSKWQQTALKSGLTGENLWMKAAAVLESGLGSFFPFLSCNNTPHIQIIAVLEGSWRWMASLGEFGAGEAG